MIVILPTRTGCVRINLEVAERKEVGLAKLSFREQIEFIFDGKVDQTVTVHGNYIVPRWKLEDPEGYIEKIRCTGSVSFRELKVLLPSVFNKEYIKKMNARTFYKNNREVIIELASQVIGSEETMNYVRKYDTICKKTK